MESDAAAERRGARRDGAEGRTDVEVRAALNTKRSSENEIRERPVGVPLRNRVIISMTISLADAPADFGCEALEKVDSRKHVAVIGGPNHRSAGRPHQQECANGRL